MKEIKSAEELELFKQEYRENPYTPNKFRYQGYDRIFINNQVYAVDDFSKRDIVEDYFHKGVFTVRGDQRAILILKKFSARDMGAYNPRSSDTFVRVDATEDTYQTIDEDKVNTLNAIFTKRNGIQYTSCTDQELLDKDFIKGKVNSQYYFHAREIKYLDTLLPYRKFDNTYANVDINRLKKSLYTTDKEEIQKSVIKAFKENLKFGTDSLTYKITEGIKYTFGVEIETCVGRLENKDVKELNVKAVHDGSLRDANGETPGGEYVSGVLKGDAGLAQLYELCRVLASKCKVNNQCGVHVHVGSLNWNKDDVVYSYILGELLEKELFSILPKSRRENSYCRGLTAITKANIKELAEVNSKSEYNILIDKIYDSILSEVTIIKGKTNRFTGNTDISTEEPLLAGKSYNRKLQHPSGAKCGYDKTAQRYCWLNYVTLLYNTKGSTNAATLEFRSHGATMNYAKIKNWIKICFAFCKFVEHHKAAIHSGAVTLEYVINQIYPKTGADLITYVKERKQLFSAKDESVDYIDFVPSKKTIKEVVECA